MAEKKHKEEIPEEEEEYKEETLVTPGVLEKYQTAGKIANSFPIKSGVLEKVCAKCVVGASVVEISQFGNAEIENECGKAYTKKDLEKGISFPVCLSVNEICGHFSPLASENVVLKEGDIVKVDLGVHIDGFITQAAHTVVVGEQAATGKKADAILAAYFAAQAGIRLMRPGQKNSEITQTIASVCETYKNTPLEGVLSHEMKKHVIDGNNCIINKENFEQQVEEFEFQVNQVFALDIIVSSGEGKSKEVYYFQ